MHQRDGAGFGARLSLWGLGCAARALSAQLVLWGRFAGRRDAEERPNIAGYMIGTFTRKQPKLSCCARQILVGKAKRAKLQRGDE